MNIICFLLRGSYVNSVLFQGIIIRHINKLLFQAFSLQAMGIPPVHW